MSSQNKIISLKDKPSLTSLIAGEADVVIFDEISQVDTLLQEAKDKGLELALRKSFYNVAIGATTPAVAQALNEVQFFCDGMSETKWETIVQNKQNRQAEKYARANLASPSPHTILNSTLMQALHLQKTNTLPVWLMRQAGRYMAEYQTIRSGQNFKDFCKNVDKTVGATLDAADRLGVDAAIIFSDILLILEPMGLSLDYLETKGPVIANPIRSPHDIAQLKPVDALQTMPWLFEAIKEVKEELKPSIPLLGFCGAPFTMASYMLEGGSSKQFIKTKKFMHNEPKAWKNLMSFLVQNHIHYLREQINAGCDAVQIFDSWAGHLTPEDYRQLVLPYTKELIGSLPSDVPVIHFGSFNSDMLPDVIKAGGSCISLDWKMDLEKALKMIPSSFAVQGNLDPTLLFCKPEVFLKETARILSIAGQRPGFIFNLGHGILPETPVGHVIELVDFVHSWGKQ